MNVLFFLFASIFTLGAINWHISALINADIRLIRLVRSLLIIILIQVSLAAITHSGLVNDSFIGNGIPLALLFGPLLFWASRMEKITKKDILWHSLPFFIAFLFYLPLLFISSLQAVRPAYYTAFHYAFLLSGLLYSAFVLNRSVNAEKGLTPTIKGILKKSAVVMMGLSLYLLSLNFYYLLSGRPIEITMGHPAVFIAFLLALIALYQFQVDCLKSKIAISIAKAEKVVANATYLKSGVQEEDVESYAIKINSFLSKKPYLDAGFSLGTLSSSLKIPRHHLSQVFNQYYGQSFLKYINSLRILYACELLEDADGTLKIDDLAGLCGYKSKTSFYRNFKEVAGMTPSEYLSKLIISEDYK